MKKILLAAFMLFVGIGVFAQKGLGEYIELDGVPAFIFYLNEEENHGLAMSIPGYERKDLKKIDKLVDKGYMSAEQAEVFYNNPIGLFNNQGVGVKKSKEIFEGLIGKLSGNGKENQEQIVKYCEENNLSLQEVFPMQYWAQSLGEGWYIPGDNELTAFAKFYFGGLGKENSLGIKFQYHAKDLCSSELIQQSLFVMVFYGLYSSTCSNVKAGFRKLRCEMVPLTGKHWLEIFDTYSGHAPLVCAVREF